MDQCRETVAVVRAVGYQDEVISRCADDLLRHAFVPVEHIEAKARPVCRICGVDVAIYDLADFFEVGEQDGAVREELGEADACYTAARAEFEDVEALFILVVA